MPPDNFEDMLRKSIQSGKQAKAGRWFRFKLGMRLRQKSWAMYWSRAFADGGKLKFAGVAALAVLLSLGGGIGVYAYTSPDVTVLHPLYPVKQGLESAELYFASTPKVRTEITMQHAQKRMAEMDKLSEDLQKSATPKNEEDGISKTLAQVQKNVETSLSSAADQDDAGEAEGTMDSLQQHLEEVDRHLGKISENEPVKIKKAVHDNVDDLRQYTKNKLLRVEDVSRRIKSPMRIKGPRVIMKDLTEADDGIGMKGSNAETTEFRLTN